MLRWAPCTSAHQGMVVVTDGRVKVRPNRVNRIQAEAKATTSNGEARVR